MAQSNSSSSGSTLPRTPPNYGWVRQPYHKQRQMASLDLATIVLNVDVDDMLLPENEKLEIMRDLSLEALSVRDPTIEAAQKMFLGKKPLKEWVVYAALLKLRLNPPAGWLRSELIHRRCNALKFLRLCTIGKKAYTREAMKAAWDYKYPLELESDDDSGDEDNDDESDNDKENADDDDSNHTCSDDDAGLTVTGIPLDPTEHEQTCPKRHNRDAQRADNMTIEEIQRIVGGLDKVSNNPDAAVRRFMLTRLIDELDVAGRNDLSIFTEGLINISDETVREILAQELKPKLTAWVDGLVAAR